VVSLSVATIGVYGATLPGADLDAFVDSLPADRASALLCVEPDARACHRSIIAERLARDYRAAVVHLVPGISETGGR
jgi:hypothetical protein